MRFSSREKLQLIRCCSKMTFQPRPLSGTQSRVSFCISERNILIPVLQSREICCVNSFSSSLPRLQTTSLSPSTCLPPILLHALWHQHTPCHMNEAAVSFSLELSSSCLGTRRGTFSSSVLCLIEPGLRKAHCGAIQKPDEERRTSGFCARLAAWARSLG